MTSTRKQQTVQFLFEASPENNITRCVISSTRSNTFENGEEWDGGNDPSPQIAADKITNLKESTNTSGNIKELDDLQHRSLTRQAPNAIKENGGDYMKTQDEYGKSHTEKENLQERSESSSKPDGDGGKAMINGIAEPFSHRTIQTSNLENLNTHNRKEEGTMYYCDDSYNTKQSRKSKGQEIHVSKTTICTSLVNENHNNLHNVIQQSLLSNPEDNKTNEQFPVVGGSNHNKTRNEITKLSFDVGGKDTKVINNSNTKFYDDDESKHLNVIDYDVHEAVPVITNLDNLESRNGYTNGVGNKASDGFNEGYNDLNRRIEQTDPKSLQVYNPVRQLSAQGNPPRLAETRIKLHANMPGKNNGKNTESEHVEIERSLNNKEPQANKVKSLIHDYERQVQEKYGERKAKHEHEFERVSNVQTVQSPSIKRRRRAPSNLGDPSLVEFSQSQERDLVSEKIFGHDHLTTKESNTSDSSNSNPEDHLETPRKTFSPPSPVNKTQSRLDDIKLVLPAKVNDTNYRHYQSNTSDLKNQSGVLHNKHLQCLDITAVSPEDLKNASPNRVNDIEDNKHLQPLPSQKTASGIDGCKSISASEVNNTSAIHSTTKEGKTCFTSGINREKLSLNAKNRNGNTLTHVGKQHTTVISNRELSSDGQLQTFAHGSHVTRAHWYDIHSPLQQSSHNIQQSIPKGESISTLSPSRREEFIKSHSHLMINQNVARGKNGNDRRKKRWKSLEELNTIDHVEEYRLPEKLNRTVTYSTDKQAMFDRNNNEDITYFSTISSNRERYSRPRIRAIPTNHGVNLRYDGKGTETVSHDSKTVHQLPLPTVNHTVANMHNIDNPENKNSNFDNSCVRIDKFSDTKEVKLSPSLERRPNMYSIASNVQMSGIANTLTPDYNTANQSPSLIRKKNPTVYHNDTKILSSHAKASNMSPLLNRKSQKLTRTEEGVNNHSGSLLRVSNYNLSSSLNALETLDLSPMQRYRSPFRMHVKPSEQTKKFNDSSDSLHEIPANQAKNLKGYNNNLSSSLTSLETLDQSPMKRSSKIKHLVNIEYYDINSDEELNSKIRRRPRTKSLNEEYKTVEFPAPTREFKSSGDLRLVGLNHEKINDERKAKAKSSAVDLSHASSLRTHGKYTELYMDSTDKIQRYSPKPGSSIESNSRGGSVDRYEKISQDSQISNYDTAIDNLCSTETHCEKGPVVSKRPVQKVSHVRTSNTSNLKTVLQQTKRRIERVSSPLHTPKTVKTCLNPPQSFSNSATKSGKLTKQHSQEYRDTTYKSIAYPAGLNANEGKYNVAKAEKEWRKKYGGLPYTNKDPLHQSSDMEFSRLFQNSEKTGKIHSSSKVPDITVENALLEEKLQDTSSSSLFSPDIQNDDKSTQAKQFTATLNELSSYVLSGYKGGNPQTPTSNNQEKDEAKTTLKHKRYYLDDEGDLSYILDDLSESPKVSMLVHTIIRLREVYSIQHYAKPQTPTHPINLGNPQMRDAIQNKPMSVVKDLILANKSVDINITSQSGISALHRAAIEGDIDAIRIMINHGANVNIRDRYGFQPVNQALRCHHYKAAMFLMDCGTDLMSYTSRRIQEFVNVKAIAKQYLRQTLKTPL